MPLSEYSDEIDSRKIDDWLIRFKINIVTKYCWTQKYSKHLIYGT